eukprot:COSAG02_NODE_18133_length_958_cov_86.674040_1_plen_200_part_00
MEPNDEKHGAKSAAELLHEGFKGLFDIDLNTVLLLPLSDTASAAQATSRNMVSRSANTVDTAQPTAAADAEFEILEVDAHDSSDESDVQLSSDVGITDSSNDEEEPTHVLEPTQKVADLTPAERALLDPGWQRENDCSFHVIALSTSFAIGLKERKRRRKKKKTQQIASLSVVQLKERCTVAGLSTSGNKAALLARVSR